MSLNKSSIDKLLLKTRFPLLLPVQCIDGDISDDEYAGIVGAVLAKEEMTDSEVGGGGGGGGKTS